MRYLLDRLPITNYQLPTPAIYLILLRKAIFCDVFYPDEFYHNNARSWDLLVSCNTLRAIVL
ncbi:MAG: hypothetical protein HC942_25695 [Microcoleus sp. SU_5_6]|nr:hypothetical protein [Microcoleus sp. SU_5_6]NJL66892.1 hypothetical protein [Microcoleus sp. SM1_3_4]